MNHSKERCALKTAKDWLSINWDKNERARKIITITYCKSNKRRQKEQGESLAMDANSLLGS